MPARTLEYRLIIDTGKGTVKIKSFGKALADVGKKGATNLKKATTEATALERTLGRLQRTMTAIAGVWAAREVLRGFSALVRTGIEYNKTMEQSRIGIGAVLAAQTQIVDATGRELIGREKILAAQRVAASVATDLLRRNKETAATYQQLLTMFQQALPFGLQERFNVKQIEDFVVAMSQAAGAMGIPFNMMAEEMRSMLRGTGTMKNTLIATVLDIDKVTVRKLQGQGSL